MGDEREISFPDGGIVAVDSGMSIHSCNKPDYHHKVKILTKRIAYLEKAYKELHRDTTAMMGENKERIEVLDRCIKDWHKIADQRSEEIIK
jgi:hypothetical protein